MIPQILKKILPKFEIYSSVISYIEVLVFKDTSLLSGQYIETSISDGPFRAMRLDTILCSDSVWLVGLTLGPSVQLVAKSLWELQKFNKLLSSTLFSVE